MARIVRMAIAAVTIALLAASTFSVLIGRRDIAIVFALAAPLGLAAFGFARSGLHDEAVMLLSVVLLVVTTLALGLSPLGVHDPIVIVYAGVMLLNALLVSRSRFLAMGALTLVAGAGIFAAELAGITNSRLGMLTEWPSFVDFLLYTSLIGALGRVVAEVLLDDLMRARHAAAYDGATGLPNRGRFLLEASQRLRAQPESPDHGVFVLADLTGFRRLNQVVGHVAGDGILEEAARRIRAAIPDALVGRIGDDEFAILALGLAGEAEAESVARRVHGALAFEHAGVSARAAVGYARFPRDARTLEALQMAAGSALIEAHAQSAGLAGLADRI